MVLGETSKSFVTITKEAASMMRTIITTLSVAWLVSACASTPDVVYSYYPSKSTSTATITQTVDCTSDKSAVIVVNTPALGTVYSADYSKAPNSIHIKALDGILADSDVAFTFFDDGRLKSVNASSTGQGEVIIKSVVSLVTAVAALGGKTAPAAGLPPPPALPECAIVNSWGGGKPVSILYSNVVDVTTPNAIPIPMDPVPSSVALHHLLKAQLPTLQFTVGPSKPVESGAHFGGAGGASGTNAVILTLQKTANAEVDVLAQGQKIFSGNVTFPLASTYALPIPRAAVFGKQSFAVTLSEAGAVTAVDYGKLTGAAGPLNSLTAAATAEAPASTASKAAEVKAQADLIAQQQRLARCQAQPDKCQ
jgi:hypothetical protein